MDKNNRPTDYAPLNYTEWMLSWINRMRFKIDKSKKPTEPGYWWWLNSIGEPHVMRVVIRKKTVLYDLFTATPIDEFETGHNFIRWLGRAIPPKTGG